MKKVIVTPLGKAVFPKINQPDFKFDEMGVYSCKLHVSEEDFNKFSSQVEELAESAYQAELTKQGKNKLKKMQTLPIRITEEGDFEIYSKQPAKKNTSKGVLEFNVAMYDSEGNKLPSDTNIGSGSKLRLSVEFAPWYVPSIGFGYTLRLRAAQVIELVEYSGAGGGNAESMGFGKVEGGFVGESLEFNNETGEEKSSSSSVPF
tara:strand:+ start:10562 stop:11173 length:612 start_codon:yes stop_codon:yes gene_type:complete